ncbi:MAG: pentapeptide repeat-containing protein [Chloroflexota bacterium]
MDERLQEIKRIWKDFRFVYRVLGGLILVGLGVLMGWMVFSEKQIDYALSCTTNLISIFITVFVINLLAEQREREREKRELKNHLIREMRKSQPETRKDAFEECLLRHWFNNGTLAYEDMRGVKLHDFEFGIQFADLRGTNLQNAELYNTRFFYSNMQGANLLYSDVKGAKFFGTNLWEANFEYAQNIELARFDTEATLPDGNKWTPATDMRQFTDPTHPNFWRSDDPNSPAYRGKQEE